MGRGDLDIVASLDKDATNDCWTREDYLERLADKNVIGKVIVRPGSGRRARAVVGAMMNERRRDRSWIDLERIVVGPEYQLHSFGRQLIECLQSNLTSGLLTHVQTTVDDSNLPLMLFLRSVDFTATDSTDGEVVMSYYWDGEPRLFYEPGLDASDQPAQPTWKSAIYKDDEESGGSKV